MIDSDFPDNILAMILALRHLQVVGFAEQSTKYQNCSSPQVLDIQAVVWGPHPGEIHTHAPLPADVSAWATGINDLEQVVGLSGNCVSPNFNATGVVPQHGVIRDLAERRRDRLGELGRRPAYFPLGH